MGENGEEIKKYKQVAAEYLWGCKYSIRNRVAKERICMTQGHGQWCEDSLREQRVLGTVTVENWDSGNRIIEILKNKINAKSKKAELLPTWL